MPKLTGIALAQDVDNALQMVASSHAEGLGTTMWHTWQAGPGAPEWSLWQP
jgi:hypothetical protein